MAWELWAVEKHNAARISRFEHLIDTYTTEQEARQAAKQADTVLYDENKYLPLATVHHFEVREV